MIGGSEINPDQWKQGQYLNLRGAQMTQSQSERKPAAASAESRGSKRRLIATIVGVVAVVAVLVLLAALRVI